MKKKNNRKGVTFNKRPVVNNEDGKVAAQGNQWVASEKQIKWLTYYMNPREDTYANAYEAALKAGYSPTYSKTIMNPSLALQWVKSAKTIMRSMNTEHLRSILEDIAQSDLEKTSDRIQAVKLLGLDKGMFVQKQAIAHVGLEQVLESLE